MNRFAHVVRILSRDGIGVMPTDTIYGVVGRARSRSAVERLYRVRKRNRKKPMILLIASTKELKRFSVHVEPRLLHILSRVWPGPVSVILPCRGKRFTYLHRGTGMLAFRVPKPLWFRKFLKRTGPLVAPSANIEGMPPARSIAEAKQYFGDRVDFYIDGGILRGTPSTLIEFKR